MIFLMAVIDFNFNNMFTDTFAFGEDPIWNILIRFIVNLLVLFILIIGIYQKYSKKNEFSFPFFLMGIMIFFMCILLKNIELSMGVGFGLFALFSILRLRSKNLSAKAVSYLFAIIGISAINALTEFYHPVRGPILINSVLLLSILLLEISFKKHKPPKVPKTAKTTEATETGG
jgi:hypothetical protein